MAGSAWVAAVSHDLREPMNAILGMTRLLLETRLDQTQRSYAEAVEDAAGGMLTLINDLLDLSRLERGDLSIRAEPFALERLLQRCLELVRPRLASDKVTLSLELAPGMPTWVEGDAGRLRQILVNLLVNAVKFTDVGGIVLHVQQRGDGRLRFTVADTGCGFPEGQQNRLLRPFERAGAAGGEGLGLAIVRKLVDRLAGTITFESVAGGGTEVAVELPLTATAAPAPAQRVPVAGRRLWLVGEVAPWVERIVAHLRGHQLDVVVASEGEVAGLLAADRNSLPDALLLAGLAPDAPVVATATGLRARAPGIALLAIVGSGLRGEADRWRFAGFDAYLAHPVQADVIVDALGVLLSGTEGRSFLTAHSLADRTVGPLDVLVVDDNPLNLRLVVILLERAGHRVVVAENGAEAVERVAAGGLDAVLMDVQMPRMDGLEATRRIRALGGEVASTPIIAVTANATAGDLEACAHAGMDDVVTKPIDATVLLATLGQTARRAGAGVA